MFEEIERDAHRKAASLQSPTNASYWFTNLSTGSGNSAAVIGGQIKCP